MADLLELCFTNCICWVCCSICVISAVDESKPVQTATSLRTISPRVAEHESNIIINAYSNSK